LHDEIEKPSVARRVAFFMRRPVLPNPAIVRSAVLMAAIALAGCASAPDKAEHASEQGAALAALDKTPWALQSQTGAAKNDIAGWTHWALPGKTATQFRAARHQGRDALVAISQASASMVRSKVRVAPEDLGRVRFSWNVPELIAGADLGTRDVADSPVRIVLAFEGDRSKLSARNAMLSELARALTGEEMPYATLMYVWCNHRAPGSVIVGPRTDRIRKLVVESGSVNLKRWLDYERDLRADFIKAFGEAPGALVGIAVMTDTDNTASATRAWYGPVQLERIAAAAP
jgi:hypothetical protein